MLSLRRAFSRFDETSSCFIGRSLPARLIPGHPQPLVLPAAISLGVYAAVRYAASPLDPERVFRARSLDAEGDVCLKPADLETEPVGEAALPLPSGSWTAYPEGVARFLMKEGLPVPGRDLLYLSDLPIGAGLSSSAALELVMAYSLLHGMDVDRVWLAKLCRRVENEFVGVKCGIMDQFAVAMGKKGCAVLLNCETLDWEHVPLNTGEYSFVILDSCRERSLAASAYNERRTQCSGALNLIAKHKHILNLCQASLEDVRRYVDDPVLLKRARHVVTENSRTKKAADLLRQGKVAELGPLMGESHRTYPTVIVLDAGDLTQLTGPTGQEEMRIIISLREIARENWCDIVRLNVAEARRGS